MKVGGPVYRIGVGGGAASSVGVQGDNKAELDFGAVQRGDAEMEQKMNRVIRACIESSDNNIICSIHDQGAGGNGEVQVCLARSVQPLLFMFLILYHSVAMCGSPGSCRIGRICFQAGWHKKCPKPGF